MKAIQEAKAAAAAAEKEKEGEAKKKDKKKKKKDDEGPKEEDLFNYEPVALENQLIDYK